MKEWMIRILIFSSGVGIGVLATKEYFRKHYEDISNEEIESCRQAFKKYSETVEQYTNHKDEEDISKNENKTTEVTSFSYADKSGDDVVSYNTFYQKDDSVLEKEDQTASSIHPEELEPFEIWVEEYENDNEFSKVTLNYYTEDGVLAYEEYEEDDEYGGIVDDDKTVGIMNLDEFASADTTTSYFRNPNTNTDFEVIKVYGSYKELVAGNV